MHRASKSSAPIPNSEKKIQKKEQAFIVGFSEIFGDRIGMTGW